MMKEFMKKIGAGIVSCLKKVGAWAWSLVKKYRVVLIAAGIGFVLGAWIVAQWR